MANKITFTYGGKVYVLEYTRKSVEEMERRGFAGAFIANHRFTKRKLINEIFSKIDDKAGLVNSLAEMYSLVIDEFVDELEKNNSDVTWKRI